MFAGRSKWLWVIPPLIVACLAGTHWYAYQLGVRNEHQRIGGAAEQLFYDWEAEAFDTHLDHLRLLSRHPNDLSSDDRLTWCRRTKALADRVEKSQVALNRQLGNDPKADRWQKKVAEARGLIAKLNPEKQ